jgi:hypothetical protein
MSAIVGSFRNDVGHIVHCTRNGVGHSTDGQEYDAKDQDGQGSIFTHGFKSFDIA